jgi:F-type H+-transporting ATPase subunit delta
MSDYRVIKRYALALLENANQLNNVETIYKDVLNFVAICKEAREFWVILKNPVIHINKKRKIIKSVFTGEMDPLTMDFIYIILDNRREYLLKDIFEQFIRAYKVQKNILETELVTATALDKATIDSIGNYIKKVTGSSSVEMKNTIDEKIIGGFALKYEDKLIDATIFNRIEQLKKHLINK